MIHKLKRVLYVSSHSLPYANNGYAIRTDGIVRGLMQNNLEICLVTRPGRPWSFGDFKNTAIPILSDTHGIKQIFLPLPNERNLPRDKWIEGAEREYLEISDVFKPDAILAASDWVNAEPAKNAAQKAGLPFFYEIRGFWELSRKSKDPSFESTPEYLESRKKEIELAKSAKKVFILNNIMMEDLVSRGVPRDKIMVVPNATSSIPNVPSPDLSLIAKLELTNSKVIGYIGAFADYEGLEDLLIAAKTIIDSGYDLKVLLVGSSGPSVSGKLCDYGNRLHLLASDLGIQNRVILTGRVPREMVANYFSLIDLFVIPRKPFEVCEIVSPIKPLEAFSFGKPVLMSNVRPLEELASQCGASTFKKGDANDLAAKVIEILSSSDIEDQGKRLRDWVSNHRMFGEITKPMANCLRS